MMGSVLHVIGAWFLLGLVAHIAIQLAGGFHINKGE